MPDPDHVDRVALARQQRRHIAAAKDHVDYLRRVRQATWEQTKALCDSAAMGGNRAFTAAERELWDQLNSALDHYDRQIAALHGGPAVAFAMQSMDDIKQAWRRMQGLNHYQAAILGAEWEVTPSDPGEIEVTAIGDRERRFIPAKPGPVLETAPAVMPFYPDKTANTVLTPEQARSIKPRRSAKTRTPCADCRSRDRGDRNWVYYERGTVRRCGYCAELFTLRAAENKWNAAVERSKRDAAAKAERDRRARRATRLRLISVFDSLAGSACLAMGIASGDAVMDGAAFVFGVGGVAATRLAQKQGQ